MGEWKEGGYSRGNVSSNAPLRDIVAWVRAAKRQGRDYACVGCHPPALGVKMNIGQLFGDDEHTAADGVYSRLLKARKWLYFSASIASLHLVGSINYSAVTSITGGLIVVGGAVGGLAMFVSLGVLLIQYILLLIQSVYAYPQIVRERLESKSKDLIDRVRSEVDNSITLIGERRRGLAEFTAATTKDVAIMSLAGQNHPKLDQVRREVGFLAPDAATVAELEALPDSSRGAFIRAASVRIDQFDQLQEARRDEIHAAEEAASRAQFNYRSVIESIPERQALFKISEYCLDAVRILPPAIFGAIVFLSFPLR